MADIPNIRRVYGRPWQRGTTANPGKVSTGVAVGVRPETTLVAHKTMLDAPSQRSTARARLAGVGGIDVLDRDPCRLGLVFDKALKLPECPAVQSRPHALAGLDAVADVGEVLHHDLGRPEAQRFGNDRFARFVVDVGNASPLFARDLPQLLFGALAAVGLQTTTKSKVAVALVAQFPAAPYLARAGGSEIVFSDIHAHDGAGCDWIRIFRFDDEIEVPAPLATNQLGLFGLARRQDATLVLAQHHRDGDAARKGVKAQALPMDGVGSLVEMDAGAVEVHCGYGGVLPDAAELLLCFVGFADREDGVADHLGAQRRFLAQPGVGQVVQGHAVPAAMLHHRRHQAVAGIGISRLQRRQGRCLVGANIQANRGRAQHGLSPLGDVFGSFDIAPDRLGADVAGCADRGRPGISAPQSALEPGMPLKQLARRCSFQDFYGIGHSHGRRNADEQVDVVGLNLFGDHRPATLRTNRIQHHRHFLCRRPCQYISPILRTPNHMVCGLIDAVPVAGDVNHRLYYTPQGAHRASAIPPATKVAGFLAEVL